MKTTTLLTASLGLSLATIAYMGVSRPATSPTDGAPDVLETTPVEMDMAGTLSVPLPKDAPPPIPEPIPMEPQRTMRQATMDPTKAGKSGPGMPSPSVPPVENRPAQAPPKKGGGGNAILSVIDRDQDGTISLAEMNTAGMALRRLDRNRDHQLNRDEYKAPKSALQRGTKPTPGGGDKGRNRRKSPINDAP